MKTTTSVGSNAPKHKNRMAGRIRNILNKERAKLRKENRKNTQKRRTSK